jgi:putative transposase
MLDRFEQGDNPADLLRGGVIASQAVLVAVAVDGEGRRQILGVDLANRESTSSWREFLLRLKQRGLHGVEFVVSDAHPGLKQAIREVLLEAAWQRCYVHFLRNALDHLPRRANDDCLQELRWIYDRRELAEVRRDLSAWLTKWSGKYGRLCSWVERLNQEIKRRTLWCGSSRTPPVARGWCGRWRLRRTRSG